MSESPMAQSPMDRRPDLASTKPWTVGRYSQARGALAFYRVMAYVTGCFLLLLTIDVIVKYLILANSPSALVFGTFNLGAAIAIGHGWCYVVYLISDFRLWQSMRWPFKDFIVIAFGGVVPLLSFFLEKRVSARARRELDEAVVLAPSDLK